MLFEIKGYKCWKTATVFNLNKMTVLTGANAAGKSSVIQSLILFHQASLIPAEKEIVISDIDLNDENYALELGEMDDVISKDGDGVVELTLGDANIQFGVDMNANVFDNAIIGSTSLSSSAVATTAFYYLNADRLAPSMNNLRIDTRKSIDCGCHGQYTANVLHQHWYDEVDTNKKKTQARDGSFFIHLDEWVDYIFPGVTVRVEENAKAYITYISTSLTSSSKAPNVGFGITYALPIITQALLAPNGAWLVVENPEAHLHAKAQSNIGYFLGVMAASGLKVVVETHSEHIVNGIRRAVVSRDTLLSNEDVNVYYCQKDGDGLKNTRIGIEPNGDLSLYPTDFFDQVSQDLRFILESRLAQR